MNLEIVFSSSVDVEEFERLWTRLLQRVFYTFSDYNTEVTFTINSGAKAVIYLIRLKSNRGSYAFLSGIVSSWL